jgi:thymidylate kinase
VVTIAVVGLDGAGKTTITRRLVDRLPFETAYLYMGMNPASSNVSLPTTRLVHARQRRAVGAAPTGSASLHGLAGRRRPRGVVWSTVRLANRIAEEVVRHGIARAQHLRGRLVITDRDFFVDYSIAAKEPLGRLDRIHLWFLGSVLPKPDLVVWLDAPPAVLYARKPEVSLCYLERRRDGLAQLQPAFARFEVVDAQASEDEVYDAVERLVVTACRSQRINLRRAEGTQ